MPSKTPFMDDSDPQMTLFGLPTLLGPDVPGAHTHLVLQQMEKQVSLLRIQLFLRTLGEMWPDDFYQASILWEEDQCMKCTYVRVKDIEGERVDSEEGDDFQLKVIAQITDTDHHFMEMLGLLFDQGERYVTRHELPQLLKHALSPEMQSKVFQAKLDQDLPAPEFGAPKPRF